MDQDTIEYLKSLGISVARGVPQLATGFVDLAALPFTATGLLKPEQAIGSTDWMTAKGYLPPKQEGLLSETTELLSGAINPAGAVKGGLLGLGALGTMASKGAKKLPEINFQVTKSNASDVFGEGAERIKYIDPQSNGFIDVLSKPDGTASIISLEVPKEFRGKGIGESLQAKVLNDFPIMQGQVSSKAAAKTAYNLGRRPPFNPNATLEDVFKMIDEDSSVNLISPMMQKQISK